MRNSEIDIKDLGNVLCNYIHYKKVGGCSANHIVFNLTKGTFTGQDSSNQVPQFPSIDLNHSDIVLDQDQEIKFETFKITL